MVQVAFENPRTSAVNSNETRSESMHDLLAGVFAELHPLHTNESVKAGSTRKWRIVDRCAIDADLAQEVYQAVQSAQAPGVAVRGAQKGRRMKRGPSRTLETSLVQQAHADGRFIYNIADSSVSKDAPDLAIPVARTLLQTLLNPKLDR